MRTADIFQPELNAFCFLLFVNIKVVILLQHTLYFEINLFVSIVDYYVPLRSQPG